MLGLLGEGVGEHLHRQHAGDGAVGVDHRARTGSRCRAGRRARRAGCRRARRSARPEERSSGAHALALQPALGQPAQRAALVVDQQRDVEIGVARASLRARRPTRPRARWRPSSRSMSRTRCSASRLSARSAPTKSSTNGSAGDISSSAGGAYWARWPPSLRIAIRSPILIASSMSWVTKTIVLRSAACRRRNSSCRRSRMIGSIAPNGSSISISGGSAASARATPTRWRWPPESCAG